LQHHYNYLQQITILILYIPIATNFSLINTNFNINYSCLREITTNLPQTSVVVNGFEVFESSRPHTQWGIQASKSSISSSSCSYTSIKQQPNYVYSSENNNCTNGTSTFSHHGNPNINSIVDSNTRDDFKKQDKSPQHQKEETLIASTPLSTPLCVPEGSSELSLLPSADATIIPSSGKFVYNL
jgi:GTPase SAR1 family protein